MKRRLVAFALALLSGGLLTPPRLRAVPGPVPIVDLHVDLSYQFNYKGRPFAEGSGEVRAEDLLRAGVRGVVLPLYVPRDVSPTGPRLVDLEESYAKVFGAILKTPPYRLPGCIDHTGSVNTYLSFEGMGQFSDHPDLLPMWVARGVRLFGLVHSYDNELSGSSGDANGRNLGLSERGRRLARRIVELGGILDVSHASDRAADQLIEIGKRAGVPVVASHSNARQLAPHPRNLTDAQIRGIAATGGVIGLNLHQRFLAARGASAQLEDLVRQVKYVQRLVGIEHLALGTDFEGGIRPVPGLENASQLQTLAATLRERGFSDADIAKIFHGNALRVLCRAP